MLEIQHEWVIAFRCFDEASFTVLLSTEGHNIHMRSFMTRIKADRCLEQKDIDHFISSFEPTKRVSVHVMQQHGSIRTPHWDHTLFIPPCIFECTPCSNIAVALHHLNPDLSLVALSLMSNADALKVVLFVFGCEGASSNERLQNKNLVSIEAPPTDVDNAPLCYCPRGWECCGRCDSVEWLHPPIVLLEQALAVPRHPWEVVYPHCCERPDCCCCIPCWQLSGRFPAKLG